MPFTAKQRRYFHSKEESGDETFAPLASEADKYAKQGKELPPVKMAHGGEMELEVPEVEGVEYEEEGHGESPEEERPKHVVEFADGGMVCEACGGEVYSHGGSVMPHHIAGEEGGNDDENLPMDGLGRNLRGGPDFATAVSYSRHRRGQPPKEG